MSDDQLIQQIKSGDGAAFRQFVQKYQSYLLGVVNSVLHHPKDAEDVTQEVFVQIYLSLPNYRSEGLKTWMTRIAVNKAIDFKRRQKRQREELTESIEGIYASDALAAESAETPVMEREQKSQVRRRMREMPGNYRGVIEAYYFEEKSYQQIADEQGVALKSVESKLYRAKQWMRKHWGEEPW
nr:sigma-70 family RNA polymerase sigma factor [Brevibacillus dissolubilis]